MNLKFAIPALAAALLMGSVADAQSHKKQDRRDRGSSTSVAGANRDGAFAGGVGARRDAVSRNGRRDQRNELRGRNSAATSTSGPVFSKRRGDAEARRR